MQILTKSNHLKSLVVGLLASATLAISIAPSNAAVTYYKSVGPHGEVRYSQLRPRNTSDFEMVTMRSDGRVDDEGKLSGQTNNGAVPAPKSPVEQQLQVMEERIKRQEQESQTRQCQNLRRNLTQLNIPGPVYEMVDGKKVYLNESQIGQKRETIKQALSQYCATGSTT